MAYVTGTATSHTDLYSKLIEFLTENDDLVNDNQEWEVVWTGSEHNGEVVLRGPGLAGLDTIYVGISRFYDLVLDNIYFQVRGMTGVIDVAEQVQQHVNVSQAVRFFADQNPLQYWFVANGRRFVVVTKMSTVYSACYAGLYHPYATPLNYPYPMFIGGSSGSGADDPLNWRVSGNYHRHFIDPAFSLSNLANANSSARLLTPMAEWLRGLNLDQSSLLSQGQTESNTGFFVGPRVFGYGHAATPSSGNYRISYRQANQRIRDAFGEGHLLTPISLTSRTPSNQTWGILDGVFDVSGYMNSSENIIEVDEKEYLVVQNVFRTDVGNYWALALE